MERFIPSAPVTRSCPATWPEPEVGVMIPQSIRMVVDFPEPLGPRNPKISPFFTEKVILSTAVKAPKRFSRFSTEMASGFFRDTSGMEMVMNKLPVHFSDAPDHGLFKSGETGPYLRGRRPGKEPGIVQQAKLVALLPFIEISGG